MFSKINLVKNGVPALILFLFLSLLLCFFCDGFILQSVFKVTNSGNLNLAIWITFYSVMLLSVFYGTSWVLFKKGLIEKWQGRMVDDS